MTALTVTPTGAIDSVDLLARIVRGDIIAPEVLSGIDPDLLAAQAEQHGVLPLVAERLAGHRGFGAGDVEAPAPLRSLLRAKADAAAVADLFAEVELSRVLAEFDAAGIGALVFKGSQLAFSHYPRPDLRPRIDSDVLIAADACEAVHALLDRFGYERSNKVTGDLVTGQSFHIMRRDGEAVHSLDVHWKVASPIVFAHVFAYEELAASAVPIPALGPAARGPDQVHALLIACVHRVAHHHDLVRLNWLYDIHLIAGRLGERSWREFVRLAVTRGVAAVCRQSLKRSIQLFKTRVPTWVMDELRLPEAAAPEPTADYLKTRSMAQTVVDEARALPRWRDRWRLVRQHVFPPADYMRKAYPSAGAVPLPALYAWRFLRGAGKWLTP